MPIVERDPWRMQYFENVPCPTELFIPTEDGDSYELYPKHRWVYNKLMIAETQNLPHAPHGLHPASFPVFSKPIYNMRGMGTGSMVLHSEAEYVKAQAPGHMWMAMLEGEHVSSDAAVIDGRPVWWRHVIGKPLEGGTFDYWTGLGAGKPEIEAYCGEWLGRNLQGYTGMVNFETIGARIIEAHLRFSDQWPDLYGKGWVDALVELYEKGSWSHDDTDRRNGFSVVLFGAHGVRYRKPDPALLTEFLAQPEVSSIQITFHDDRPPSAHAMPPGGFRLAIVNCWDLGVGLRIREQLALLFWSTQKLGRRRKAKA